MSAQKHTGVRAPCLAPCLVFLALAGCGIDPNTVDRIDAQQLAVCWETQGKEITPTQRDHLRALAEEHATGTVKITHAKGCWATVEVRPDEKSEPIEVCGFYDRPVVEACSGQRIGLCRPGWELVDCYQKPR
jgi:hypothetical protein